MELSSEAIFEFLDLYEKEAVIWNPKHLLHRNRNEIRDAWKRIQDSFSVECSVDELKKKRDSLMATFRPLLIKVKKSMRTGTGRADVFKPTWFAFDRMSKFLMAVYQARTTRNTEETTEHVDVEREGEDDDEEDSGSEEPATADAAADPNVPHTFQSPTIKGGRKRKLMNVETIQTQMTNAYKLMKTVANNKKPDKDNCSVYTELLAMKLREFDDFNRATLMNEIDNLMFRAKMRLIEPHPPTHSRCNQQFPFSLTPLHIQPPSTSPSSSLSGSSPQNYAAYHSPSQSPYSPYSSGQTASTSQQSQQSQYFEYTELSSQPPTGSEETNFR